MVQTSTIFTTLLTSGYAPRGLHPPKIIINLHGTFDKLPCRGENIGLAVTEILRYKQISSYFNLRIYLVFLQCHLVPRVSCDLAWLVSWEIPQCSLELLPHFSLQYLNTSIVRTLKLNSNIQLLMYTTIILSVKLIKADSRRVINYFIFKGIQDGLGKSL